MTEGKKNPFNVFTCEKKKIRDVQNHIQFHFMMLGPNAFEGVYIVVNMKDG